MTAGGGNLATRLRRPGFTLAELIVGLLLLAIIGGATAAFASAISRGWKVSESTATSSLTITRTMLRIADKVHRAKALGQWRPGSLSPSPGDQGAALLFWRADADGDGKMQLEEMQLLEHDPATERLLVWEVQFPDPATRTTYNGPFPITMLAEPSAITDYKALTHVKNFAITRGVKGTAFNVITPTAPQQRPQLEFRLKFDGPNGTVVDYGTAAPRSLWKAP